ncbi:gp235 [Bacillus phage W.Ph.]|uniref:Gp235 n=1 Tax=Bacillus phage W.Ph. TaxID=764595 RepID=G9B1Y6_9CAUD|nr:gp235 [Bacillus phage W.Ph.]ADH03381.1 gp235 [Bacillus phage W.Ph.]
MTKLDFSGKLVAKDRIEWADMSRKQVIMRGQTVEYRVIDPYTVMLKEYPHGTEFMTMSISTAELVFRPWGREN